MPTYFARRYLRQTEHVGRTEKTIGLLILLLTAAIVAAYVYQALTNDDYLFAVDPPAVAEPAAADEDNPFPDPNLPGWVRPREASRYTPDNLYLKIDGRAGLYLQFHVAGLTFGSYSHRDDATRTIDVYWYDMAEPANALGIYRTEAAPEVTPISFGPRGYQTGGAVFFIKGAAYVQVLPARFDDPDAQAALAIARAIAGRLEDRGETMWADAVLPADGRVPGSIDFIAENAFGLDFLGDVYTARYKLEAGEFTLFVHRAANGAAAQALFDEYAQATEQYGKIVWRNADPSHPMVAGNTAGMVDVIFVKGRYLAGVVGADAVEPARKVAAAYYHGMHTP